MSRQLLKDEVQMAIQHVIRERLIKMTLRIHLTPVRIAIVKKTKPDKCW